MCSFTYVILTRADYNAKLWLFEEYQNDLSEFFSIFGFKFSVYLNWHVFLMSPL